MKYAFITGIPASGKSYLADKVARATRSLHINTDNWREELGKDDQFKSWVNFFYNKDEREYWKTTSCDDQWTNLVNQSEAFWPKFLEKIREIQKTKKSAIFEGVNILPHLARRDLDFSGIALLGESFEIILERNKQDPRWGNTKELQIKEAEAFWNCERARYQQEAEKYGFKFFTDPVAAENELLKLIH